MLRRPRRLRLLLSAAAAAALAAGIAAALIAGDDDGRSSPQGTSQAPARPSHDTSAAIPLRRLVGQKLMVRAAGARAGPRLLRRVRRGEAGGIIVFPEGAPAADVGRLIARLQRAAHAGGSPSLLVAVDQEGGEVKRLPGPPARSPPELGAAADAALASREGERTGRYLSSLGIDVDLAPVVDVPASPTSFIASRAYSGDPKLVGRLGAAFAQGLRRGGVAATAKHFPGLGRAPANTDLAAAVVGGSAALLARDLIPFRAMVKAGVPLVMASTAVYPAYDPRNAAAWSQRIIGGELRRHLGFRGVVITDDLATAGVRSLLAPAEAAVQAAGRGDVVLFAKAGSKRDADAAFAAMLAAARSERLSRSSLEASYGRIVGLKRSLAGR